MAQLSKQLSNPWEIINRRLIETNRILWFNGVIMVGLIVVTTVLAMLDSRTITGAPAWFKPMKFAISTAVYSFTFLWILSFVRERYPKLVTLASVLTGVGLFIEVAIIALQAARGEMSHYNMSTPLNMVLYNIMAVWIGIIWVMNLLAAVLVLRYDFGDKVFAWGLRMGLLVTLLGAGLGFTMTANGTEAQMDTIEETGTVETFGAHTMGAEDGGPGLPFLGWSTVAGDVRVPHFIGLHALQIMPLVGWAISQQTDWLNEKRRQTVVIIAGCAYAGLVLLLLWQALRGQPVIAPDALTLGGLGGLLTVTAAAFGLTTITYKETNA